MEIKHYYPERIYFKRDVDKAYTMGLENAIVILEQTVGLSRQGQVQMIKKLKERIMRDKIETVIDQF